MNQESWLNFPTISGKNRTCAAIRNAYQLGSFLPLAAGSTKVDSGPFLGPLRTFVDGAANGGFERFPLNVVLFSNVCVKHEAKDLIGKGGQCQPFKDVSKWDFRQAVPQSLGSSLLEKGVRPVPSQKLYEGSRASGQLCG